jgi:hypothetical protein
MADLEPYLAKLIRTNATGLPLDRWGHPLVLRVPGTRQEIDIYSVGADGLDDGGERDDISSWAGINEGYYEKRSWPQGRRILRVGPFLCLSCLLLLAVLPWRIVLSITVLAISLTAAAGFSMLYHPAVMHSYNQSITLKIGCALLVAFVCFVLVLRDASKNLMTRHRSTTNQGVQ